MRAAATGKERSPMELRNVGRTISAAVEADHSLKPKIVNFFCGLEPEFYWANNVYMQ